MMSRRFTGKPRPGSLALLIRCRAAQLANMVDQRLRESPGRVLVFILLLLVIWGAAYWLLTLVLRQIGRWELVAVVANQHLFVQLFLVLAVMLMLSNAILTYGSLFGRDEPGYLLALPIGARKVVCLKWIEGVALSSWAFLLLGVPLMLAVARNTDVQWYYYPLFIGHFLGFIVIPGTLGVLAATAVALWAPRRPVTVLVWCCGAIVLAAAAWAWSLMRQVDSGDQWLRTFYAQLSLAKQPLLPSTWSARGIVAAMEQRAGESLFYLAAVAANGAFLAWLTVNLVGRAWPEAYNRAQRGRARSTIRRAWFTNALCWLLFFYLPRRWRIMMLKDLRAFLRDAPQWTQMVIMFGLLVVYAVKLHAANMQWLPLDWGGAGMRALLAFLNLVTVSLILATFTSRFIFPLLSLESQQLWLLGLLPARRSSVLLVKFVFSLTLTGLSTLAAMAPATAALDLPASWAAAQIAICLGICVGLSGLAVGLGARFPVVGQRNPARIASGVGGTFNLVASMLFVASQMACVAVAGLGGISRELDEFGATSRLPGYLVPGLVLYGCLTGAISLWAGARHFDRLEC